MEHKTQWIWLPEERYPDCQTAILSGLQDKGEAKYAVAEFARAYRFSSPVVRADLRFSGDAVSQLFCNGKIVGTGPASAGGDFIGNERPRENCYAFETTLYPDCETLSFFARVQLMPIRICEFSKGRGGFMLSGILTLADGTRETICTGSDWLARKNGAYAAPRVFDGRVPPDAFIPAECVEDVWQARTAPIPIRAERELFPQGSTFTLKSGENRVLTLDLDRIWGGFVHVKARTQGEVTLQIMCRELEENAAAEQIRFTADGEYRGFFLHSAGNMLLHAENHSDSPAELTVSLIATHYPVTEEADTVTSDPELDLVLQTCKHTLKICRQTHHLDSTRHCEPLACTGDYNIEAMMTPFAFGDMRLAEFDLLRTAFMLEREKGRMFHTTYSLIWVRMLLDVYKFTGNSGLLKKCETALGLLLDRFAGYVGENGLIETPPDYMFVDWIYIDGHSLHHPPKALGQSCLNMYYFGALDSAEAIYRALSLPREAESCATKRDALGRSINALLYDPEKGMFFEGLNTPTPEHLLGEWMPRNTGKRYYLKQSNTLAAFFGVCDDDRARMLIHKIMADQIPGDIQPYFLHYLLEAVFRMGLREQYTLSILERWKAPVRECAKGLVEGFVAPEPGYGFDHSHAWGGTPLYSLPRALMGLEILIPGMTQIALSPSLLGLDHAQAELLTPFGKVTCRMEKGNAPVITCPPEVRVTLR